MRMWKFAALLLFPLLAQGHGGGPTSGFGPGGGGTVGAVPPMTDGQILIGVTADDDPNAASLLGHDQNILIVEGPGSVQVKIDTYDAMQYVDAWAMTVQPNPPTAGTCDNPEEIFLNNTAWVGAIRCDNDANSVIYGHLDLSDAYMVRTPPYDNAGEVRFEIIGWNEDSDGYPRTQRWDAYCIIKAVAETLQPSDWGASTQLDITWVNDNIHSKNVSKVIACTGDPTWFREHLYWKIEMDPAGTNTSLGYTMGLRIIYQAITLDNLQGN